LALRTLLFLRQVWGGDTIAKHVNENKEHVQAKIAAEAKLGKGPKQSGLLEAWSKGVAKGTAAYPSSHAPGPVDIPFHKLRSHFESHRCHGFFAEEIQIGGQSVQIGSLKRDLHRGEEWYADPNYSVMPEDFQDPIQGTFWHVACKGFQCSKCSLIPSMPDFRKRALREMESELKRGTRVCQKGVSLEHLRREKLIETAREWQSRFLSMREHAYFTNISLLRLSKTKVQLSDRLQEACKSGSLPELAELFKRASDLGALDGRSPLHNFLLDLSKNMISVAQHDGDGRGKRYHHSTKLMFETLARFGGPLAHNFASSNLLGPVLNTSLALYRKEAFLYSGVLEQAAFQHVAKILAEHKARLGIVGPVPIECSEDEMASIRLATFNRRLDVIEGFCGKLAVGDEQHKCSFDCQPSAATYESITRAFKELKVASMCRLLLVNPLAKGMPRLVYALLPTCNMFDAKQVYDQWRLIKTWHAEYLQETVGPLIAHASDEDKRRVKCQVASIGRGVYGLDRPGFIMKAEMEKGLPLLMDQDPPHCGKKLRHPLLNATRDIFWGVHIATKNHLRLVMRVFPKEEHGLLEEDVDVKDKQNFASVQRIAFPKVRSCLEKLTDGCLGLDGVHHQEDCKGTLAHLEVLWAYLEVFYGRDTLRNRVLNASFVTHMLFFGSEFIKHRGLGHTLKQNWITREAQLDMLISIQAAVNLIRMMRDFFPHLPVALDMFGTDCCEDTFSLLGQEVVNKHNFSFGEALERLSHICRTAAVKVDAEAPTFANNRRRKNIWWEGGAVGPQADLAAYGSVSEPLMLEAWNEGLEWARKRAEELGMKRVLQLAGKWEQPAPASLSQVVELTTLMRTEEEDAADMETVGGAPPGVAVTAAMSPLSDEPDRLIVRSAVLDAMQQLGEVEAGEAESGGGET
jgi:hypothetical protein